MRTGMRSANAAPASNYGQLRYTQESKLVEDFCPNKTLSQTYGLEGQRFYVFTVECQMYYYFQSQKTTI